MDPVTCELCLTRTTSRPFRAAGLDACAECFEVQLTDACAAWGLTLQSRHWTEWKKQGDATTLFQYAEIRVSHPHRSPTAVFTSESPTPAWLKWLGLGGSRDPEVGDPLFDDHVHIGSDHPEVPVMLLDEGLQTGIMSVLGAGTDGRCAFEGGAVFVKVSQTGESRILASAELEALAVAIAVQVERYLREL